MDTSKATSDLLKLYERVLGDFKLLKNGFNFYEETTEKIIELLNANAKTLPTSTLNLNKFKEISKPFEYIHYEIIKFTNDLSEYLNLIKEHHQNNYKNFFSNEKFMYNKIKLLDSFKDSYESQCIVVNAVDDKLNESGDADENDMNYIYDLENTLKNEVFFNKFYENFENNEYEFLKEVPKPTEVFGILIDNRFYRAVRENDSLDCCKEFKIILIDHGRILKIITTKHNFYKLPLEIQNENAMAIPCKFIETADESREEFSKYCLHNLYFFKVEKVTKDYLQISLKKIKQSNLLNLLNNQLKWFQIYKNCASTKPNIYPIQNKNQNVKDYLESALTSHQNNNPLTQTEPFSIKREENFEKVTPDQRAIFYEEPTMFTTNATKAVTGYLPKDEKRLCKFTDDHELCFKGNHCQKEHKKKLEDGWTRDKETCIIDIPYKIELPAINSKITIVPTHFVDVCTFYGHLIQKDICLYPITFRSLTEAMNAPIQIQKYEEFTINSLPGKLELVIAKYTDNCFYRAKIMDILEDGQFKVFYVDYGNDSVLSYKDLRKWVNQLGIIPFEAVLFRLSGIKVKRGISEKLSSEAENYLVGNFLNEKVFATVVDNKNELVVKLTFISNDNDKCDLSQDLVQKEYAEYNEIDLNLNSIRANEKTPG